MVFLPAIFSKWQIHDEPKKPVGGGGNILYWALNDSKCMAQLEHIQSTELKMQFGGKCQMARPRRFELLTSASGGPRSIQLS